MKIKLYAVMLGDRIVTEGRTQTGPDVVSFTEQQAFNQANACESECTIGPFARTMEDAKRIRAFVRWKRDGDYRIVRFTF